MECLNPVELDFFELENPQYTLSLIKHILGNSPLLIQMSVHKVTNGDLLVAVVYFFKFRLIYRNKFIRSDTVFYQNNLSNSFGKFSI